MPSLALSQETQGKSSISSQSIFQRSMVSSIIIFPKGREWSERSRILTHSTGRGGQSALRFARLRMEKRHNYMRKVAEVAVQLFITNDKPNVAGLVLAGSADFKTELSQSDMFDQVLYCQKVFLCDMV